MKKNLLTFSIIFILLISNVYFFEHQEKLDYNIIIGVPDGNNENYLKSQYIDDKEDYNMIMAMIMSMAHADSYKKPVLSKPQLIINISSNEDYRLSYKGFLYLEDQKLILGNNQGDYKEIMSPFKDDLEKIAKEYIDLYKQLYK